MESDSEIITPDVTSEQQQKQKRRIQKYRTAWEKMPEFKSWLRPVSGNRFKAGCIACLKTMVSEVMVLRKHSMARTHVQKMKELRQNKLHDLMKRSGATSDTEDEEESALQFVPVDVLSTADGEDDMDDDESIDDIDDSDEDDDDDAVSYNDEEIDVMQYTRPFQNGIGQSSGLKQNRAIKRIIDKCVSKYSNAIQSGNTDPFCAVVSKRAPFWKSTGVVNGHITELKLTDYRGRYLILMFYPQDFSALCPNEIIKISEKIDLFHSFNTEVVACSVDSSYSHQAWSRIRSEDGGIASPKVPLLSDPTHSIAERYGCYLPSKGYTARAHYIIDSKGILRHMMINDITVARSIDELIRLVQAFQYADQTKTYCPVEWKPGQPTIH